MIHILCLQPTALGAVAMFWFSALLLGQLNETCSSNCVSHVPLVLRLQSFCGDAVAGPDLRNTNHTCI